MIRRYRVTGSTANGVVVSPRMAGFENSSVTLTLYSEGVKTDATDGLITIDGSIDGVDYEPLAGGTLQAKNIHLTTRTKPSGMGAILYIRFSFSDVTGVDSFISTVERW